LLCFLACTGCARKRATDDLIADLKSSEDRDRLVAARLLQGRKGDAEKVVPALTEALKDKAEDVRWSAAIGLGYFGEKARSAIPALQEAQRDHDARVREAAGVALSRIDPSLTPAARSPQRKQGK
jgi:hypothetical protein